LSWLRIGLVNSKWEGILAWGPLCCLSFTCGQNESSRVLSVYQNKYCILKTCKSYNESTNLFVNLFQIIKWQSHSKNKFNFFIKL
jgi:hypothetical protein